MSAVQTSPDASRPGTSQAAEVLPPISWRWPVVYGVLTAITTVLFWLLPPGGESTTFQLAARNDLFSLPTVEIPLKLGNGVLVLLMIAGTIAVTKLTIDRRKVWGWLPALIGTSFVLSFLVWIGAGRDTLIPLTALLAGGLALSVPLIFGAMCGILCERSGVVNIAIEGQLLAGAFLAAVAASLTGVAYAGLVAAPIAGVLVAALLAIFATRYAVDQIIVGVVLNVLVVGLTGFLFSTVLTANAATWNTRMRLPELPIPGLSQIPIIGPVLFRQTLLVYLMYVIVIVLQVMVFRSRWGLRMRAVGEHPKAADTVGIKVNATRVRNVLLGGAIAGLGGAFFTIGSGLAFGREMSAGNGFIALAAMILGRWNPKGALLAALLFGFSRNLGNSLAPMGSGVPSELLNALPYIVTIIAVAGLVGRVRPPAASNIPYTT